ncbi:MAG: hypothetical protein M3033_16580 [Acidobacteriota bacterium]|nr:hypothetical protein [Acidobacteriota bacterium]
MGIFDVFKRKKPVDSDATRREILLRNGRITDGRIIDSETTDAGEEIVFYIYNIQGVDFESSEYLSDDQKERVLQYSPGAKVAIRYDPKNHGNSMLV